MGNRKKTEIVQLEKIRLLAKEDACSDILNLLEERKKKLLKIGISRSKLLVEGLEAATLLVEQYKDSLMIKVPLTKEDQINDD